MWLRRFNRVSSLTFSRESGFLLSRLHMSFSTSKDSDSEPTNNEFSDPIDAELKSLPRIRYPYTKSTKRKATSREDLLEDLVATEAVYKSIYLFCKSQIIQINRKKKQLKSKGKKNDSGETEIPPDSLYYTKDNRNGLEVDALLNLSLLQFASFQTNYGKKWTKEVLKIRLDNELPHHPSEDLKK